MKLGVHMERKGQARATLKKLDGVLLERAKKTTQAIAKMLMEESQQQAPEDTGALKKSAYMSEEATVENGLVKSRFGFGKESFTYTGPDKKGVIRTRRPFQYSVYVHEKIAAAAGGRYDFINLAIELRTADIHRIVRETMKKG